MVHHTSHQLMLLNRHPIFVWCKASINMEKSRKALKPQEFAKSINWKFDRFAKSCFYNSPPFCENGKVWNKDNHKQCHGLYSLRFCNLIWASYSISCLLNLKAYVSCLVWALWPPVASNVVIWKDSCSICIEQQRKSEHSCQNLAWTFMSVLLFGVYQDRWQCLIPNNITTCSNSWTFNITAPHRKASHRETYFTINFSVVL